MSSIYDKSSLVLIPSGTKTGKVFSQKPVSGDGDFTFTRASAATRVNADGLIEKGRENVLRKSNQPNTHTINLSTYSGNQADPFGGNTAWAWRETATTGQHYGITNNNQVLGVGVWTFSVYVKPVNKTSVYFTWNSPNASNYGNVSFSFNSKTFTTSNVIAAGYEELTNGWFRLYYAINVSGAGSHNVYYNTLSTYTGDVNNGFDFTRFQIERGLVATDYIETDENPVEAGITDNVPRLDYTDSSCPALLLEPQRTNLIPNSEYFGSWSDALGCDIYTNTETSPEGVYNAATISFGSSGDSRAFVSASNSSATYIFSVYAKSSTSKKFRFRISGSGGTQYSDDLATTSEWQRFEFEYTGDVTAVGITNASTADGGSIFVYGFQQEAGSYATSYIPTYGSSVSRVLDSLGSNDLQASGVTNNSTGWTYIVKGTFNGNGAAGNNILVQRDEGGFFYRYGSSFGFSGATKGYWTEFNPTGGFAYIWDGTQLRVRRGGSDIRTISAADIGWSAGGTSNWTINYVSIARVSFELENAFIFNQALTNEEIDSLV